MINKPEILSAIEPYADLKKRGPHYWTLCPLPDHIERTASFKVDPERQTFHCFGCNRGGDVIQFVMLYHNLSFKTAVNYLNIDGKCYRPDPREIRKRELVKVFRQCCNEYYDDLCALYRTLQRAKEKAKTVEEVEALSEFYHLEPIWIHRMEILQGNDDEMKFQLYQEIMEGST